MADPLDIALEQLIIDVALNDITDALDALVEHRLLGTLNPADLLIAYGTIDSELWRIECNDFDAFASDEQRKRLVMLCVRVNRETTQGGEETNCWISLYRHLLPAHLT